MKVYRLLLVLVCLLTSARLYAQKAPTITISLKNVPLETVLAHIKKQTGVKFFYDKEVLKLARKVSVQAEKADLETVLKQCLRNTSISFTIFNNTVVLSTKKDAAGKPSMDSSFFSKDAVHGFIYNTQGQALANANVIIKRTHRGTSTNAKGEFVLEDVRTNDTLRVSYMGYESQERSVSMETEFNFYMKEAKNDLDAIIVQAYGTTTKRLAVGEITQVTAEQIKRQPVTNVLLALNGLVPGLLISPRSGFTGGPVKVEIRGRNSISSNATSDPLYVIDDVPFITPEIASIFKRSGYENGSSGLSQSGLSPTGGQNAFFSLNPLDIESITVLKDGAATAMYGSRAGNGVILITTKKGKPGELKFNVSADHSINRVIGHWDMLNTSQYLQMRREAFRNDGITPSIANAPDLVLWDTTRYTDWQKQLWNTSRSTNIQTSISGGSNLTTFSLSGSYLLTQDLAAIGSTSKDKRATIGFSLTHHSPNNKLLLTLSTIYGYTNFNQIGDVPDVSTIAPNNPPIFDSKGNLNYADWNAAGLDSYPFATLLNPFKSHSYMLNSGLNINYNVVKGLNAKIVLGYNNSQLKNSSINSIAAQNPIESPSGLLVLGNNENVGWNINPEITYSNYIGKGTMRVTIGSTLNSTTASGLTTIGSEYTSDQLLKSIGNAPTIRSYQAYAQNKYTDVHARFNYNWEDKYILEVSGNRDGSSSFGPGRQFGNFWSVGGNWIASEEKWLKKALPSWISLIKFSGTYAVTGVSGGDYQYLSQWAGGDALYNYNGISPLIPIHAVNQDYHWQTNKGLNLSFDLGLFSDRFHLHAARYVNHIGDQLSQLPTPVFTGFPSVTGNSKAKVQNAGIELTLDAKVIDAKDFSWSAIFNISHNSNKLLAFPGIEYTPDYTILTIGKSLNSIPLLHYVGIDPQTGSRTFEDHNHNGAIDLNGGGAPGIGLDDRYISIDPSPKLYGGASNTLRYKNITFNFDLIYKKQTVLAPSFNNSLSGRRMNVSVTALNNRWQKPGDIATNPRLTTIGSDFYSFSDAAYTDGSFLRLSNVYISYSLPLKFSKKLGLKSLDLAISMQNVFTLSKYEGVDPETLFGRLPQPKIFNGKITFNF